MKALLLALLCSLSVTAAEPAGKLRASLETKGNPWVGQKLTLVVEILAPGTFSGAPAFDLPQIPGGLILPPEGHAVVSSEQADGTSYTVQRREFAVLARRAGPCEIPPFTVRFGYKISPLDPAILPQTLQTTAIRFTAILPPGAEKLGSLITARNLEIKESWDHEPGAKAKPGDAFVRTLDFSAPEVPAMLFPPFPAGTIPGLGIYPADPVVLDRADRDVSEGHRRDRITYVCERAGRFVIPAVTFTWWDPEAKQLQKIDLPARSFEVVGPYVAPPLKPFPTARVVWISVLSFASIAVVFGLWKARRVLRRLASPFFPRHLVPLNPSD